MKITFNISKPLATEAVKSETYIKGSIDSSMQQGAEKLRYNETAGDTDVHERKLAKDFVRGVERLKSVYVDFFTPSHTSVGNTSISATYGGNGSASMTLVVSRRFNGALTDALANYSQQYVEEYMASQWWLTAGMQQQAEPHVAMMKDLEERIRKAFAISSPLTASADYSSVSGKMCNDDGSEFMG